MQALHDLADFANILRGLEEAGFDYAVIGGCAVGAYAHFQGETVISKDLDVIVAVHDLDAVLDWARRQGARVVKRPRPRALSVAVIEWGGRTVDFLTEARGMPEPAVIARNAREFTLARHGVTVPVADPYDLLANKLAVDRPQDRVHVELLRAFIDEEVVATFREERRPRHRIRPARRLMDVLQRRTLPRELAVRLVPLADDAVTRRFLVHHAPDLADDIIGRAPTEEQAALRQILEGR